MKNDRKWGYQTILQGMKEMPKPIVYLQSIARDEALANARNRLCEPSISDAEGDALDAFIDTNAVTERLVSAEVYRVKHISFERYGRILAFRLPPPTHAASGRTDLPSHV